jgi:hypothetical protein
LSDTEEQPRDDGGRFTAAEPQAFGLAGLERDAGYLPIEAPAAPDDILALDESELEAAFFPSNEQPASDPNDDGSELPAGSPQYQNLETGEPLGPNRSVTLEKAADDYKAWSDNNANAVDYVDGENLQALYDQRVAEAIKADPNFAAEAGHDPKELAKAAEQKDAPETTPQPAETPARQPNESEYDYAARQLLDNPVAVDVLRTQLAATEQARAQYGQQLNDLTRVAEMSFLAQFPEFQGVSDPGHAASIASSIQQQNPARWQAIMQTVAQHNGLWQAQQQQQRYAAARAQQEFHAWAKTEDAKLDITDADGKAVMDYLPSIGLDRDSYAQLLTTNPMARSAIGQRTMIDAAKYHALQKSAKAIPTRSVPSVQKPGTTAPRQSRAEANEAQLMARLQASGSEADGWALLQSRMKSRG